MPPAPALTWTFARFDALGVRDLYDALQLRALVFCVEQHCIYLDPDGVDLHSAHLLGRDAEGSLRAYLRVVDPGVKYAEPSLGRVVTHPEARGGGLGRVLLAEGLARCDAAWPGHANRISAQAHLAAFYAGFGYQPVGETYLEDGIPHLEMWRPPCLPPSTPA
ncbi:MAG: GNAT family N-acetyltransferase [Burkholderiales bacterium]|nr:GNAT family N-acetyltransferase [Burkholderiales bacterium]